MPTPVQATAEGSLSPQELDVARTRIATLGDKVSKPLTDVRLTVRKSGKAHAHSPFVADAAVHVDGRTLAAHATGGTAEQAVDAVTHRLERQIRRVVDADVALRNEPRVLAKAVQDLEGRGHDFAQAKRKPPAERRVVRRRTYARDPEPTLTAIADMLDLDELFHLFVHVRTNEDVVVYWNDAGRIALLYPPGSILEDEGDIVVPQPTRYSDPLPFEEARAEMDMLNHRWLYFIDAADGRGKVLYLRYDGDYGLVEPE